MEQQLRGLVEALPLIVAIAAVLLVVIFAFRWAFRWYGGSAPAAGGPQPLSADPQAFAEYSYARMLERYLHALRQAGMTHGVGIVLALVAVLLVAAGVLSFENAWSAQKSPELVLALLLAAAAAAVLSGIAFVTSTSERRLLITLVDTIRTDWKLREAVRLAETMAEPDVRTRLVTALAFQLSGAVPTQSMLRELIAQRAAVAAPASAASETPTFFQWRAHFRRCGRKHGRRLVLERDYL
jgi:hypothetical protein